MISDEYFEKLPKFENMTYWFYRRPENKIEIILNETKAVVTVGQESASGEILLSDDAIRAVGLESINVVESDWAMFKLRPEYKVGLVPVMSSNIEELKFMYAELILGCGLIKAYTRTKSNPDDAIPKVRKCLDWLKGTDFYTCPASTQYHDSIPSGLLIHTLNVVNKIVCLISAYPFNYRVTCESAVLTALVHDWCKIGLYTSYMRNVKNEETGQWEQVACYKYVDDRAFVLGHGVSSMYLAMKFFYITMEEAAAIRWHMGRWNCIDAEVNELQQANRSYPLVHLLQFADQLAITDYK